MKTITIKPTLIKHKKETRETNTGETYEVNIVQFLAEHDGKEGLIVAEAGDKVFDIFLDEHKVKDIAELLNTEFELFQNEKGQFRFTNYVAYRNIKLKSTSISTVSKIEDSGSSYIIFFEDGTVVCKSYTTKVGDGYFVDFFKQANVLAKIGVDSLDELVGRNVMYVWKQFKGYDYAEVSLND